MKKRNNNLMLNTSISGGSISVKDPNEPANSIKINKINPSARDGHSV